MTQPLRMIVGLGNPGSRYACHRHNVGFDVLDALAPPPVIWRNKFNSLCTDLTVKTQKVLLLKPQTFMNESGRAVQAAAQFYKIAPSEIFVFHDELDLEPTRFRIKQGGGAGGHNGLRSIDAHIGKNYWRGRIGIGHPGHKDRVHGYVLSDFSTTERNWINTLCDTLARHISPLIDGEMSTVMNKVALAAEDFSVTAGG